MKEELSLIAYLKNILKKIKQKNSRSIGFYPILFLKISNIYQLFIVSIANFYHEVFTKSTIAITIQANIINQNQVKNFHLIVL